ncbi:hypothetical protein V1290_002545 [Bradyrhizobium sp. AZCC 1578]|uniref:hypothetical protein n=1 Tax=Bradyrhizobium sp. AZCC 1578 TaxID=3117027 RepID=UPI002FF38B73
MKSTIGSIAQSLLRGFPRFGFNGQTALLVAVVLMFSFTLSLATRPTISIPDRVEVSVVATGKRNPSSLGTEVWTILGDNVQIVGPMQGWEARGNRIFVSYQDQPTALRISIPVDSTKPLTFHRHPFSGIAAVGIEGRSFEYDLFGNNPIPISIPALIIQASDHNSSLRPTIVFLLALATISLVVLVFAGPRAALRNLRVETDDDLKNALFVFLSFMLGAHVILTNSREMGWPGVAATSAWYLIILGSQLILIQMLRRLALNGPSPVSSRIKRHVNVGVLLADGVPLLIFLCNVYVTLLQLDTVSSSPGIMLSVFAIIFVAALASLGSSIGRRAMLAFCLLVASSMFLQAFRSVPPVDFAYRTSKLSTSHLTQRAPRRPNIYYLSLDALGSERSLQELLQVDGVQLFKILAKHGFHVGASRAPGSATLETFYKLFTLRTDANNFTFDFFKGLDESVILGRLRLADYKIQSIQGSSYFGLLGAFWDFAIPARRPVLDYCWSVRSPLSFFYGLCSLPLPESMKYSDPLFQLRTITERVSYIAASETPWFTFAHVLSPSHTAADFIYSDQGRKRRYRQHYMRALIELQQPIEELLSQIQTVDPTAIVIVHGDHGPIVTRGWSESDDVTHLYSSRLVEADRYEVTLAVFPRQFCREKLSRVAGTIGVLPAIFDCLQFPSTSSPTP